MNEVERCIIVVLELAQSDFSDVSEIFSKYSDIAAHPVVLSSVSEGIKVLQYVDTLTQKLNHIVSINQALAVADASLPLPEGSSDDDPAEFIFRLNYFQAIVAHSEFLMTVRKLMELIDELIKVHPLEKLVPVSRRAIFRNLKKEESNMKSLFLLLRSMYTERRLENRNGMCPLPVVTQLTNLYTMKSERLVLEWLKDHPLDDINELMLYSHNGFGREAQQAEFF